MPRRPPALLVVLLILAAQPGARTTPPAQEPPAIPGLGSLDFPTSARGEAQRAFLEGVAWLHSFEYEEALDAFHRAQALDRHFAMAFWGEAMCYNQTLWRHENRDEALRVLGRLAPTAVARQRLAPTPRERGYLAALEVLFGDGEKTDRDRRYAEAMRALAARFPDDQEATVFAGLAMMALTARGAETIRRDGDDPSTVALVGSPAQAEAAAIFTRVLERNPWHPGALHYLIHVYDDPEHARLALDAARRYPDVAPQSSHALHMPSHIFFQLGLWADAARVDIRSFAASDALVRRKGLPLVLRDHHGLSWLIYEHLQLGRYREAFATIGLVEPVAVESDDARLKSLAATMTARYAFDTEDFSVASGPNVRNADEAFAVGVGAARRGDVTLADEARDYLARQSNEPRNQRFKPFLRQMELEIDSAARFAEGRTVEALARAQAAAAIEADLPAPIGPPAPAKPSFELYGDLLLDAGRYEEAGRQYRASVARWTNRSRSLLGVARAAALGGDGPTAREFYSRFADNWEHADPGLPELAEARAYLDRGTPPTLAPRFRASVRQRPPTAADWRLGLGVLVAAAAALVAWRVRASQRVTRQQRRASDRR